MTPGIILAIGAVATFLLATWLHHRRETAALYLPGPRTPERDQGFNEGLNRASAVVREMCRDRTICICAELMRAFEAEKRLRHCGALSDSSVRSGRRGRR